MTDVTSYDTEVECLAAWSRRREPGDVVGLMCHAEREEAYDWIARHGGTADAPRPSPPRSVARPADQKWGTGSVSHRVFG